MPAKSILTKTGFGSPYFIAPTCSQIIKIVLVMMLLAVGRAELSCTGPVLNLADPSPPKQGDYEQFVDATCQLPGTGTFAVASSGLSLKVENSSLVGQVEKAASLSAVGYYIFKIAAGGRVHLKGLKLKLLSKLNLGSVEYEYEYEKGQRVYMATFFYHIGKMVKIYHPGGSGSSDTSNDVFKPLLLQQPPTNSTIRVNPILFHHNKSNATSFRPRFISNRIVNKWFSDVNAASRQQEKFKAFKSGLKNGKYLKSKTIECVEMYLCFLAMGCFLAYMGVNVIPWVVLDIYFYFRKRRNEKKIKTFKRGFRTRTSEKIKEKETSAGKSRWTYTNRLGSLFSSSLVTLFLVALCNVLEGVDAYPKMPDDCLGKGSTDRDCDPRKAVDELIAVNADGSGTHATYGPMKDWDMSEVTDISHLFWYKGTMNADLSRWDVSSVTTMYSST